MLICPVCKNEFQEGYKTCSDCNSELIEIPEVVEKGNRNNSSNMKRTFIGIALLLSSTIAYVGISISAAICGSQLTQWITDRGKIGTALTENSLLSIPFMITTIMFVLGIVILLIDLFSKTDK